MESNTTNNNNAVVNSSSSSTQGGTNSRGSGGRGRGGRGRSRGRGTSNNNRDGSGDNDGGVEAKSKRRAGRGGRGGRGRDADGEECDGARGRGGRGDRGRGRGGRGRGRGRGGRGGRAGRPQGDNAEGEETTNEEDDTMIQGDTMAPNAAAGAVGTPAMMGSLHALSPFISAPGPTSVISGGGGVVPSHPPIFVSRLDTHLPSDVDLAGMGMESIHDDGEDHIAEQLAAGLLIDDGDDDDIGLATVHEHGVQEEEEKKVDDSADKSNPKGKLQFVKLPTGFSVGNDGNVVTSDEALRQKKQVEHAEASVREDEVAPDNTESTTKQPEKKKRTLKTKGWRSSTQDEMDDAEAADDDNEAAASRPTSASEAITKLKATEVSIGETTKVQVKRTDSTISLSSLTAKKGGEDGGDAPVINLLGGSKKITGAEKKTKGKKSKGKNKALGNDDAANLKAARHFNRSVRACVERSDPDGMREILRDKRNHNFALDANVLETVMKAYCHAAMFEDALYCLRNCSLPGTLKTAQAERILLCLPQNLRNSSAFTAADMINALCIATEFDQPTSRTYFMRIVRGIALEFLEEATSARDRICSAPCERLVRSAQCVVDARLRRGKKPTDLVVQPGHQLGVFIPDTLENRGIQAGDAVSILPYAGPYPMSAESLDRNMIEATVTNAQPLVLRLADKANADLHQMLTSPEEGNVYRIDKLANRMGYNRQLSAAVSVASPLEKDFDDCYVVDRRRPSPALIKAITAMDENINKVMSGGNFNPQSNGQGASGDLTSTAAICSQAIPWNISDDSFREDYSLDHMQDALREESLLALDKYGALEGLNGSQSLAVKGAASNRLTLVQGPPGTGKTAVAIRILQHWARLAMAQTKYGENPAPILATSDSNIAVDNLVEGCANVGLRVVRLGRPEAIRPELLRYCIDRPPEKDGRGGSMDFGYGGMSTSAFKERMKVLKNAQVVCCTCIGSGGDILDSMTFERVMVDEATQATEPAVLVPLTRGCRQLVLVGDHCQLPPTVLSTRAEEEGLGVPLFSRMVACGVPPFMLDTQYRMHPGISMFPSDLFYGGKLNDGVSPPERRPLAGFPWPREEFPVAFIPIEGSEIDDGVSKANEAEAHAVCEAVVALLGGGQCTVSDIAVVTPYSGQVRLIRRALREVLPKGPPFVEVSSTDGFQGREKEAVVFSAVRSNSYGSVGFVSDWRRINVSFTRARRALIVVGNPDTLRRGDPDTFGAWIQWADAHGVNMNSPGRPRGRYDAEVLRKVRGGTTAAEMLKDVLERQQAQLKSAERQQAQAMKNAVGHVMGKEEEGDKDAVSKPDPETLKNEDNSDRCWDDSDDEDVGLVRNVSRVTLATASSNKSEETSDEVLDAWDL